MTHIDDAEPVVAAAVDTIRRTGASPRHDHHEHELLWPVSGTFRVEVDARSWLVAPGSGVWVPAGTRHRMVAAEPFRCGWALIDVETCPPLWNQLTAVTVSPLLAHLLSHLASDLGGSERARAEAVLLDLLHPLLSSPGVELPMPRDERCRLIADAVLDDPASGRELADWATDVGASTRTLTRLFQRETSMSFGQWRTHARIRAAIAELAGGRPVGVVARRVGYASSSAFVTAFRRTTGRTPSSYLRPEVDAGVELSIAN